MLPYTRSRLQGLKPSFSPTAAVVLKTQSAATRIGGPRARFVTMPSSTAAWNLRFAIPFVRPLAERSLDRAVPTLQTRKNPLQIEPR